MIHKEAARRRSFEFLGLQSQVVAGSSLDTDRRNEFLLSILEKGQNKQPNGKVESSSTPETETYGEFYDRVIEQIDAEEKMREEHGRQHESI